jgi:hypothetical protein
VEALVNNHFRSFVALISLAPSHWQTHSTLQAAGRIRPAASAAICWVAHASMCMFNAPLNVDLDKNRMGSQVWSSR